MTFKQSIVELHRAMQENHSVISVQVDKDRALVLCRWERFIELTDILKFEVVRLSTVNESIYVEVQFRNVPYVVCSAAITEFERAQANKLQDLYGG